MNEFKGLVTRIVSNRGKSTKITLANQGSSVTVNYKDFLWIYNGDKLVVLFDNDYNIVEKPLVIVDTSFTGNTVKQVLKQSCMDSNYHVKSLVKALENVCKPMKLDEYLSKQSDIFMYNKLFTSPMKSCVFAGITKTNIKLFLTAWNKFINLRRLYNIGITKTEINKSLMLPYVMYYMITDFTPMAILGISSEKATNIYRLVYKDDPPESEVYYNSIMNKVYNSLINFRFVYYKDNSLLHYRDELSNYNLTYLDKYKLWTITQVEEIHNHLSIILKKIDSYPIDSLRLDIIESGIELNDNQLKAIEVALNSNISIITGAPGTGKSTILLQIIMLLEANGYQYLLSSYTGCAVSVMREKTKRPAYTMHSLLSKLRIDIKKYQNSGKKLFLIIDEMSMVYTKLFYSLLLNIKSELGDFPKLILLGDVNQLEPMYWGKLLQSMIKSGTINVVYLNKNYRSITEEGEENGIILNCESIIKKTNRDFIETNNFIIQEGNINTTIKIIESNIENGGDISDLTVLCPYRQDAAQINNIIQRLYNKDSNRITDCGNNTWIKGDKVMLIKNNTFHEIYNGQEGIIVDIMYNKLYVKFKNNINTYQFIITGKKHQTITPEDEEDDNEISDEVLYSHNLVLSYSSTIHKAQGKEWKYVIIFISGNKITSFLNKSLLYVAISRAVKFCLLVGYKDLLIDMKNKEPPNTIDIFHNKLIENMDKKEVFFKEEIEDIPIEEDYADYDELFS